MEQFVWMEVRQLITGIRELVQELTIGWFTLRFVLLSLSCLTISLKEKMP
jgi:hypothetical protein